MPKMTITLHTLPAITIDITEEEANNGVLSGRRMRDELKSRNISLHEFAGIQMHGDPDQPPVPFGPGRR